MRNNNENPSNNDYLSDRNLREVLEQVSQNPESTLVGIKDRLLEDMELTFEDCYQAGRSFNEAIVSEHTGHIEKAQLPPNFDTTLKEFLKMGSKDPVADHEKLILNLAGIAYDQITNILLEIDEYTENEEAYRILKELTDKNKAELGETETRKVKNFLEKLSDELKSTYEYLWGTAEPNKHNISGPFKPDGTLEVNNLVVDSLLEISAVASAVQTMYECYNSGQRVGDFFARRNLDPDGNMQHIYVEGGQRLMDKKYTDSKKIKSIAPIYDWVGPTPN